MLSKTTYAQRPIEPLSLSNRIGLFKRPVLNKGCSDNWSKSNDISRVPSSGIVALNIPLASKHSFEVSLINGDSDELGSEQLQIEALRLVHMAVSKHPDFVDKHWSEKTPVYEVLGWATDKLSLYCGTKYEWTYFNFNQEESNLSIQSVYNSRDNYYGVNMYHLPQIEEEYPDLFKPIIILLAILKHKCHIQFWNSEIDMMGFSQDNFERLIEEDDEEGEEDDEICRDYHNFHKKGMQLLKHIDNYNNSSAWYLEFYLNKVDAKSTWEQECKVWLLLGLHLVKQDYTLWDFDNAIHNEDEWPILPHEWLKFDWNSGGRLWENSYDYLNSRWQESGSIELTFQLDIKDPVMWKHERPEWPNELLNFMEKGIDLMTDFKTRNNA